MPDTDTIVALSSGAVPSGVAIIRLSGPAAGMIVAELLGQLPTPRKLTLSDITLDGDRIDRGLVAWMPGPASFTGEDCAELQVHGSPAVVRALLRRLSARPGIRLAEAGEFTRRAFENGKLDLVEAQGLGDLIEAETENQRALAYARLEGGLTRQVEGWRERLLDLRAEIEAQLDFSDEGDVGALPDSFASEVTALGSDIADVLATRGQGRILRSGFRVVLAGPPNAGKSSLLNALSRSEAAIVSDEPGTTRDLKEIPLDVKGQLIILIDSAGLRDTTSKAEAIGVERAREAMLGADHVLWLQAPDVTTAPPPAFPELAAEPWRQPPVAIVGTKSDLGDMPGADLSVSVSTGAGIEALLQRLYEVSGAGTVRASDLLVSHERDRVALQSAVAALAEVTEHLEDPELAAEDLRHASAALERLLGRMDAESVLDRLFSAFCIGK
ncbi:tRNA uridine-5-carboxymethylaminomethyl(34) synthesis GTPase MnmE [Devosia sp. ZB163]|uniref:tRNA uridine-5-carboxymethylaminomethyl(34) synthesis GTPase MnmE n=1 Tax=Devosia sp. ZB163 TaxID=3025938 RepID=UPI00236246C1|nr:tRNA uridine-5-carboxymethylaminomethyl(34) synthesis GTPase MnmE [Devosia sp. ZB163]MDC9822423.1 tRNA uridine-5-carboxymethylaminomethyl(34) synthesis GTPase MnmE [Devosia sp. ZB163]